MTRAGHLAYWLMARNPAYILARLAALLRRYGLTSGKAERRVVDCVRLLARYGARPTFPTPGRVIERYSAFCRQLQGLGAELAVHSHDHIDFRALPTEEAVGQLERAAAAFEAGGIQFEGFRCPYLGYTEAVLAAPLPGALRYSSNRAIWWDVVSREAAGSATAVFESLQRFYRAEPAEARVSVPRMTGALVELPVSLPDDIQLRDGLGLGEEGLTSAWSEVLRRTHARGELFVLMFHPELFEECRLALEAVLALSASLRPAVWLADLRRVARWWREKSAFSAAISADGDGLRISFTCTEHAVVLVRGVSTETPTDPWAERYRALRGRELRLASGQRPLVGLSPDVPEPTVAFLREQGYVVDQSVEAERCGIYLDAAAVAGLGSEARLVDHVEYAETPLVRFWRWPEGARSALCVTGDLDALSLVDYALRPFAGRATRAGSGTGGGQPGSVARRPRRP